ncbi:hypothetical protein [Streptomyces thioluteus]|uniref:hypothetical protein n=1 Tax=Streptomyces thioluteus TaxID=66431 RepID=UPI0031EF3313
MASRRVFPRPSIRTRSLPRPATTPSFTGAADDTCPRSSPVFMTVLPDVSTVITRDFVCDASFMSRYWVKAAVCVLVLQVGSK